MKEIERIITELTSINETLYQITGTDSYTQRCRIHDVIEKLKQIDSLSLQSSKGISEVKFKHTPPTPVEEFVKCECGRIEPLENARLDKEGLHTCDKCYIDMLTEKLSEGSKTNGWVDNKPYLKVFLDWFLAHQIVNNIDNSPLDEVLEAFKDSSVYKIYSQSLPPNELSNQTDAVEFAEWLLKNYKQDSVRGWYSVFNDGSHGKSHIIPSYHTTQELYLIFQKKKEAKNE